MADENQDQTQPAQRKQTAWARIVTFAVLGLGAMATCGLVVAHFQQPLPVKPVSSGPVEKEMTKELKELSGKYFHWPVNRAPDLIIALTGEQHSYEAPCGCSSPQHGGLERRYNFFKFLRDQGVEVLAADLGDIYFREHVAGRPTQDEQLKLKYAKSMEALDLMQYSAVCVGEQEFRYGLLEALSATVLGKKNHYRVLGANLSNRDVNFPNVDGSMIGDYIVDGKAVKVAFAGLIGKSVVQKVKAIDSTIAFDDTVKIMQALDADINAKKPDIRVMLYQGDEADAKMLAATFPNYDIILCLSKESDPSAKPLAMVGKTQIVGVGHKGKYIGVVAVFRKPGGGWDLRFDPLPLGPEFQTAKEARLQNTMNQILEKYTETVRDKKLIDLYPQVDHPLQVRLANAVPPVAANYVGSNKCQTCHPNEFAVWDASKHAGAFTALEEDRLTQAPGNRKTDGECVVCHVTGFGYKTGYKNETLTANLKGVGCESCHGPAGAHVAAPNNKNLALLLSPWKQKPADGLPGGTTEVRIDVGTCQKCHDTDNDHNFKFDYWRKIAHGPNEKATKKYYEDEFKKRTGK